MGLWSGLVKVAQAGIKKRRNAFEWSTVVWWGSGGPAERSTVGIMGEWWPKILPVALYPMARKNSVLNPLVLCIGMVY